MPMLDENKLMPIIVNHRRYCIEQLVITRDLPGDIAELGVGCGKNVFNMACVIKDLGINKKIWALDCFTGLPYTDEETCGIASGSKIGSCYGIVPAQLELELRNRGLNDVVEIVIGLVEETLPVRIADKMFSLVWLDMDLYMPTLFAYKFMEDRIVPGGLIGFHDHESHFEGITKVVAEAVDKEKFEQAFKRGSSIFFRRKAI